MGSEQDKQNYIKNLVWMMCCDGKIDTCEKKFLKRAAKEVELDVDDWNRLVKDVVRDGTGCYPVGNRDKAIATLKSLMVMAKADKVVDPKEKQFLSQFAKSIGVSKHEWDFIRKNTHAESLFAAFKQSYGSVIVVKEDFEKIEDFKQVAGDNGLAVRVVGFDEFVSDGKISDDIVCFHVPDNRGAAVLRCKQLLEKNAGQVVAILTRYQGHLVKYLHEAGLKKCVIEPVYAQDIEKTFSTSN
jgi:uncharacterized tellurite resistance protein B-like protein